MGWLKRIFSMGEGEEEPEEEIELTVELAGLADWVDKLSNRGFERVKPDIDTQFDKLFEGLLSFC